MWIGSTLSKRVPQVEIVSSDSSGQLHVLLHQSDSVGVDRAQVCVLEEASDESLSGFLQSDDGLRLESETGIDV